MMGGASPPNIYHLPLPLALPLALPLPLPLGSASGSASVYASGSASASVQMLGLEAGKTYGKYCTIVPL